MFTDHEGISNWVCLACNDSNARPVFYEKAAFIEHLEERHSRGIKPQQMLMLVSSWKRKTSLSIRSCPLCGFGDEDSDAVLNHTAEHLHSFSLRSLPWAEEDESYGDFYDGYYKEHPYFDIGRSVGTETEPSRSTMTPEHVDLEELPTMDSDGEATENSWLTEEHLRDIAGNLNAERDMLDEFLYGIESQEPSSFASISNLGSFIDSQSKYKEAKAVLQKDLVGLEGLLGPEQPDTLSGISNLGSVLLGQFKFKEAETMHRRALEGREKILGPEHPDTLDSISQLGLALAGQGKYEEANASGINRHSGLSAESSHTDIL
ncbi:hypothetical protein BDV09DRAFT_200749 [Aspergillus tetrazonus]